MNFHRIIFSIIAVLAILWSFSFYQSETKTLSWWKSFEQALAEEKIQQVESGEVLLPTANAYSAIARDVQEDFFPPQSELANQLIREALKKQPFKSAHWVDLSYTAIRSGDTENALHYLEQAERLDPGYVDLRIEAITLWLLLDQKERALSNFAEVLKLSPQNIHDAISALALGGVRFEEYSEFVHWESLNSQESQMILQTIALDRPSDYNAVLETFLENNSDAIDGNKMIASAVLAKSYEASFFFETKNLFQNDIAATAFSGNFRADELVPNSELMSDPRVSFTTDKFGWLRLSEPLASKSFWLSQYHSQNGVLQIDLPTTDSGSTKHYFWNCLSFINPPSDQDTEIFFRIQTDQPEQGMLSLCLFNLRNQSVGQNAVVVPEQNNWSRYILKVPPKNRFERYLVRMTLVQPKQNRPTSTSLYLDGVFLMDTLEEEKP